MLPNRGEWKRWATRTKVEYLAQIATLLTLLVTVFFSAMAWREARITTGLQREMFAAQNAPRLIASGVTVRQDHGGRGTMVVLTIKNVGGSRNRSFCLQGFQTDLRREVFSGCRGPWNDVALAQGETFEYVVSTAANEKSLIGFKPVSAMMANSLVDRVICKKGPSKTFVVMILWSDVVGTKLETVDQMAICGEAKA